MVNHNHVRRGLVRFQFQAELLLHRGEERRARTVISVRCLCEVISVRSFVVRRPFQRVIVAAFQSSFVRNGPAQLLR